jgi:iron complex outermembrane receptor protein
MAKKQLQPGNRMKFTVLASTISAILGAGGSGPAQGQAVPEEVLVTGSRIVRRDLEAPTPIMTIDTERLDNSSTLSVESVLNQMPQFNPAQSQFSAQGEIQTSPIVSPGAGTLNLRGIGPNRTLILIDGRRAQPLNASLTVDLNSIPAAAIERVETITGGASAVYGADALAGVVNFVLKDNFAGISMDVQTGITEAGDGEETRFSSLLGMNSDGGNANMLLGVEWYERSASMRRDRDFYVDGWFDPFNQIPSAFPSMPGFAAGTSGVPVGAPAGSTNLPSQAAVDSLFPQFAPGTISPNSTFYFNPDGTAYIRTATGSPGFNPALLGREDVGDGQYGLIRQANGFIAQQHFDGQLTTPLTRRSAFAKAHVDIADNLRAFAQANFSRSEVPTFSFGPPPAVGANWGGSIPNDGRDRIPAGLQTLLDSRQFDPDGPLGAAPVGAPGSGAGVNWLLNRGLDFIGQFGPTNTADVYQVMAGLEGSFPNRDWTWEAYYSSGNTNATNVYYGMPSVQRWKALVGAAEFGLNANIQQAGASTAGNYAIRCTSGLPIFYGTSADTSPDCINSILGGFKSLTNVSQDILEANLQGKIVDMKAGELRFAAGVSHRKNGFSYDPANPQSSIFDIPLGIFVSNASTGETKVAEIYGELLVPVTERLDLEFGYRHSNYDSAADTVGTYKALFDWSPTDWMSVRGGYQVANRAPNTAELFQSDVTVFDGTFASGDPCVINNNVTWGNKAGNPNRLAVQTLCRDLIGNDNSSFGAPGSALANNFQPALTAFTGISGIQVGNPNLVSEDAETWTLGAVFAGPGDLENLTASIDFYNIKISNAIATFTGPLIYQRCFNSDGRSNPGYDVANPFCQLINRDPATGGAGLVELRYLNTGLIETAGVDIAVNWQVDLPNGGNFYISNLATYLDKFDTRTTATDPLIEWKGTLGNPTSTGAGMFDYRFNSTFGYRFGGGNANVGLRWRYLPDVKAAAYVNDRNTTTFPTESYSNFDLFAGYTIGERYQLRGGIDNVFNADPAIVGATPTDTNSDSTLAGFYDPLGRRLYVGVKIDF